MKYRLAKIQQGSSIWFVIQRKSFFGWVAINEPGQKRVFFNEEEAMNEYNRFINGRQKPCVTVIS